MRIVVTAEGATLDVASFRKQIIQRPGTPLNRSEVDESLKNLYATGRFATLGAEARLDAGGVDLVFTGRARFFVGTVGVRGAPKGVPSAALASSAGLSLGSPVNSHDLDVAAGKMQSLLKANSYYRAHVGYGISRDPADQVANITFSIDAGPAARLRGVEFQGKTVLPPARLRSAAGWRGAIVLSAAKLQHGLFAVRRLYAGRGYLEATIDDAGTLYDAKSNTIRLIVRVTPGPLVRVHVEGARISKGSLEKTLPVVFEEGLTDDLSLAAATRDLETYFERKGFFAATAKWRRIQHPSQVDITFAVELGPRSTFKGFDFSGNHAISSSELSPLVSIRPASFPGEPRGVFSREMLAQDVRALVNEYQGRGFAQARVTPVLHRSEDDLNVTFDVSEGPRREVGKLTLSGVDAQTAARLRPRLRALPGQPYSPQILSSDRNTILGYFTDEGFNQASVAAQASKPVRNTVDIDYRIRLGPRERVGSVVILGNEHTRTGVILRRLTLKPGDPLSLSQVSESQRKLYDLGLFNSVQIAAQNPGGDEGRKTILVRVREADRWTLGYGFGIDMQRLGGNQPSGQFHASPRLSLEATRTDVGGRNQTLSFRGRVSDLETGAQASYLFSDFLNKPSLSLHLDLLGYQTRDVLTFTSRLEQASLTLEKQLSPSTFVLGRYNYRRVSVYDLHLAPEEIPLVSQPVQDAGFESTWIHDTRDNPADAVRGSYSLVDASISTTGLGSAANFVRFLGQNSTYYRVAPHLVFARNTQFGVETSYGPLKLNNPGATSGNAIPLAERFFAGGGDSLRAFSLNQAGPRDPNTGYPVGGNGLFVNSLELRMPFRQGQYGVVVFDDAGNVFSSLSEMRLLKFDQSSPLDLNYTVDAVGVGFRYKTPIGPVRLDLSYGLNMPRYQIAPQGAPAEVLRLPAFQYFISIGQSF